MKHIKMFQLTIIFQLIIFQQSHSIPFNLLNGLRITLQAEANGNYVSADNSGYQLTANNLFLNEFILVNNYDGTYSLQDCKNGFYVSADYHLSPPYLVANRSQIDIWEKFQIIDLGDKVALKAYDNSYVCADLNISSAGPLAANRSTVGAWERFTMRISNFGVPQTLDLGTWTHGYPSGECNSTNLTDYVYNTRDCFRNSMLNQISQHYPTSIYSRWLINRNDANTTFTSFQSIDKDACEVVLFVGHGWDDGSGPVFQNCNYPSNNFALGGMDTKWVMFDACEVLSDHNPSTYDNWFNGVHGVLGFVSEMFYWDWKSDWWHCTWYGCDYTHNWDYWEYFWNNWFNGQSILSAWSNAIISNYNHANTGYFHGDVPGYEYGMLFIFGNGINNSGNWQYVDTRTETIASAYKNPTPLISTDSWHTQGTGHISTIIGTPHY